MNSKKDSKRIKQKQERNFLSPVPRRKINGNEASPNDLQDLSPYRPVYGSHSLSRHPPLSNTEMTFINTPVPKTPKPIIDDLSEQQQRSIEGVISFGTENDDDLSGYEEDSEINQLFEEETEKGEEKGGKLNPEKADHKPGNHYLRTAEPKQKKESSKKSSQPATDNTKKVICNCKKTKCLKLYCDCFRINQICDGCNCVGCHNLPMYNQQRNNSMMSLMDRNPQAFKPKIDDEQHAKGCHCKKSNCLKKYCQCYQAGLKCGSNCKCQECKNKSEEDEDHRREGNNSMNSLIVNIEQLMKEDEEKQYKDKITGKVIKNKKDKVEPESVRI